MDNQSSDNKKQPWFGPKRFGYGTRPTSWQGWLIMGIFIIIEIVTVSVTPSLYPSWFRAKTAGTGFVPVTWQGWLAIVGPALVLLILIGVIRYRQRQK